MDVRFGAVLAIAMVAPVVTQWRDPSPHQVQSVTVDGATRLEVLDWGGSGRPVLFVGCYLTAHVYDNIAPKPGCGLDWLHGEILRHRRIEPGSRPAN